MVPPPDCCPTSRCLPIASERPVRIRQQAGILDATLAYARSHPELGADFRMMVSVLAGPRLQPAAAALAAAGVATVLGTAAQPAKHLPLVSRRSCAKPASKCAGTTLAPSALISHAPSCIEGFCGLLGYASKRWHNKEEG